MVSAYLERHETKPFEYTAENPLIITVTEVLTYKRCRLQWHIAFRENLAPRQEQPYFYVGRITHKTLEYWEKPTQNIEHCFARAVHEDLERVKERYEKNFFAKMSPAEIDSIMLQAALPHAMVLNYKQRWQTPLPPGYKMIQAEQTCLVDIPGVPNVKLEGTLDGLVINVSNGKLYVLERKTYENRPKLETLGNAEQFVAYCWILSRLFPDKEVGGVLYDGLWKREVPPRGRKFEDLFMRELLPKSAYELAAYEDTLVKVAREIAAGPEVYAARIWQGCYDDKGFDKLCSAIHKDSDIEFIRGEDYVIKEPRWFEEEGEDV